MDWIYVAKPLAGNDDTMVQDAYRYTVGGAVQQLVHGVWIDTMSMEVPRIEGALRSGGFREVPQSSWEIPDFILHRRLVLLCHSHDLLNTPPRNFFRIPVFEVELVSLLDVGGRFWVQRSRHRDDCSYTEPSFFHTVRSSAERRLRAMVREKILDNEGAAVGHAILVSNQPYAAPQDFHGLRVGCWPAVRKFARQEARRVKRRKLERTRRAKERAKAAAAERERLEKGSSLELSDSELAQRFRAKRNAKDPIVNEIIELLGVRE